MDNKIINFRTTASVVLFIRIHRFISLLPQTSETPRAGADINNLELHGKLHHVLLWRRNAAFTSNKQRTAENRTSTVLKCSSLS